MARLVMLSAWRVCGFGAFLAFGVVASASAAVDEAAAGRGEAIARKACANCHALGPTAQSNWSGAPAFRDMRIDYNAIAYERRLAELHQGHVDMPPLTISLDDVRDVRAYVRSLRQAKAPTR